MPIKSLLPCRATGRFNPDDSIGDVDHVELLGDWTQDKLHSDSQDGSRAQRASRGKSSSKGPLYLLPCDAVASTLSYSIEMLRSWVLEMWNANWPSFGLMSLRLPHSTRQPRLNGAGGNLSEACKVGGQGRSGGSTIHHVATRLISSMAFL